MQLALVLALAALLPAALPVAAWAPPASRDATTSTKVFDKSSAIVVFKALPLATYDGRLKGYEKTRPAAGKLLNANSATAKKYLGYLKTQHSAYATWLRANAPGAKITSHLYASLNAVAVKLNGTSLSKLKANSAVSVVEYTTLYRPTMSESHKLINAHEAWMAAGGRTDAGRGIKIGIIDSGIDVDHPFFDPAGFSYPTGFPKCDARNRSGGSCEHVTPKVIVAKVFNNKLNQSGFDADPVAGLGDHGTHVAGTAAGVTGKTAIVQGVEIDDMSGVAPGAWLGNYNVFPGDVVSARSEDILNAVEAAVLDGMDVINLSLGGGYRGNNDLLAKGLDTAVAAGVVVVSTGGNEGPGGFTIGSPGRARNIITVGASTNQHFVGQPITYSGPNGSGTARAATGDFDPLPAGTFGLFDAASNGCTSVPAGAAGKLVLIDRGVCAFSVKVANAKAAGAAGVIIVNNVAGDPTAAGRTAGLDDDIPAVMISKEDGAALRASGATSVSVAADFAEFVTDNGDILAGFSSQGPTFVDYAVKPDVTSVGVNVLSSVVCSGSACGDDGDWAFYNGTSMAAPHIAGSAAVLLDLDPSLTPAQVKSAIVNTADPVVTNAFDASLIVGPQLQGAGRQDLGEAMDATVAFAPVSASFGRIPASRTRSTPLAITVRNLTGTARTFAVAEQRFNLAAGALGSVYGAGTIVGADSRISTPTSLTVPANGTATLTVRVAAGLPNGTRVQGWITLTGGGQEYQLAYWAQVAP
ncbi:MAG TPA: S8 family serine peptidase [Candidatus Limnocylindrales bacterium]|nr:S8 family serine peptidase [Candidatus Limnocylindrales bacterium]